MTDQKIESGRKVALGVATGCFVLMQPIMMNPNLKEGQVATTVFLCACVAYFVYFFVGVIYRYTSFARISSASGVPLSWGVALAALLTAVTFAPLSHDKSSTASLGYLLMPFVFCAYLVLTQGVLVLTKRARCQLQQPEWIRTPTTWLTLVGLTALVMLEAILLYNLCCHSA
jgi:hypothetical protein